MNQASNPKAVTLLLLLSILVGLVAISHQSLWIDEANSAIKAVQPSWADFRARLVEDRGSDLQMPLYMGALWGWEKFVGRGEFALRALNLPLFSFSILLIWFWWPLDRVVRAFVLGFALLSPFLWVYLDEVRPYVLQFFGACLMIGPLLRQVFGPEYPDESSMKTGRPTVSQADLWVFCLGAVILCGASLIGVIYTFFFGLALALLCLANGELIGLLRSRRFWLLAFVTAMPLTTLGIYYVWTMQVGAKASAVGQTNLFSLGFVVYELLGFSGLGPGRAALRENPVAALREYALPLVMAGVAWGFFWATVAFTILQQRPRFSPKLLILSGTILGCSLAILVLGVVGDFRIVGRHFMPLYPFLLLLLAYAAAIVWQRQDRKGRLAVFLLVGLLLFSCLGIRFSPVHAKDDYRSAAAAAKETLERGGVVWWAADPAGAEYYGLPEMARGLPVRWQDSTSASCVIVSNLPESDLWQLPRPDLVIFSKPDIYDGEGNLARWLGGQKMDRQQAFPAFALTWLAAP